MSKNSVSIFLLGLAVCTAPAASASVVGDWCFYEQEGAGQKFSENVDISLQADGSYTWQEGQFKQTGKWTLKADALSMTDVGVHRVVKQSDAVLELVRGSTMRFKRGKCDPAAFSDQDVIAFQNAASLGEMEVLRNYLDKGFDIDTKDWRSGDTALTKAAKFCRIDAAMLLIERGARKDMRNDDEKLPRELAQSSRFHQGCAVLVDKL